MDTRAGGEICRVSATRIDSTFAYRKPGQFQTPTLDRVFRSLYVLLDEPGRDLPTRLYLGIEVGPPEAAIPTEIEAERYHARERSLELRLGFDSTLPDGEIGPALGRAVIEAIEFGRRELARRKVDLDTRLIVARIERWIAEREWLALVPRPPILGEVRAGAAAAEGGELVESEEWPERLEIHWTLLEPIGAAGASAGISPFEAQVDSLLKGSGALEGNEVGGEEWVTYIECLDAEAALAKLRPHLKEARGVGSIYAIKCSKVMIR